MRPTRVESFLSRVPLQHRGQFECVDTYGGPDGRDVILAIGQATQGALLRSWAMNVLAGAMRTELAEVVVKGNSPVRIRVKIVV